MHRDSAVAEPALRPTEIFHLQSVRNVMQQVTDAETAKC